MDTVKDKSRRSLGSNKNSEESEEAKEMEEVTNEKIDEKLSEALKRGGKIFNIVDEELDLDDEDKEIEL